MSHFGAVPVPGGVRFRVWAPDARDLQLVIESGGATGIYRPDRDADGVFDLTVDRAAAGDRYRYRLNGGDARPDPASRFQPDGVHGPSEIVDPGAFGGRTIGGATTANLVLYELHVGAFTCRNFRAAANGFPTARLG